MLYIYFLYLYIIQTVSKKNVYVYYMYVRGAVDGYYDTNVCISQFKRNKPRNSIRDCTLSERRLSVRTSSVSVLLQGLLHF